MKKIILVLALTLAMVFAFTSCELLEDIIPFIPGGDEHVHAFGEWEVKTAPTCTEAGVEHRVCECNEEETREIAATGHSYESVVTAPTCTEGGYTTYTCSCGDSYVADETAKAGHNYDAVVTAPTCTEGGYTTYTCSCGDSYVADETAKTGHNYDAVVIAPTCIQVGYTTYTCSCGDSYVGDETAMAAHSMIQADDDTHHWLECSYGCGTTTDKVAHGVDRIEVSYDENGMMEYRVLTASDFVVTAICECGKESQITEGIEVEGGALVLGENRVTVKVGDASVELTVNASPFSINVGGNVKEDTYVYSDSAFQEKNYASQPNLSTNGNSFRVILKYNFSDVINSIYYNEYKDEATVQFVFTMTKGSVNDETRITFKAYPIDEVRGSAPFGELNWKNYDSVYGLGWGKADGFVNKEAGSPYVNISNGTIVITLTYREIEKYIDANGDALFVFAIWQDSTQVGSVDNTNDSLRPKWNVNFSNNHTHAYIEEVASEQYLASAECGKKAVYYKSCSCGEAGEATFNGDVVEHSFGEWTTVVESTCAAEGTKRRVCSACETAENGSIDKIAHNYLSIEVVAPTCTAVGYTVYTCSACNDTYNGDEVEANGHSYDEVVTDPTCTAKGYTTFTCSVCTHSYKGNEVEANGHSYGAVVTDPTCTSAGYTTYTCPACNDAYVADEVEEIGHSYEAVVTNPTCTDDGYTTHTCPACGDSYKDTVVAAAGHDFTGEWKCDETYHWKSCHCGELGEKSTHSGGEATEDKQASCETCNQPYGGYADHVHKFTATVTEPTCTSKGYTTYSCDCLYAYQDNYVDELPHTYTEEVAEEKYFVSANCEEYTIYYKSCSCGAKGSETFEYGDIIAHKYHSVVTAPTCTTEGYTTYTCPACDDSYIADKLAARGHDMVDKSDDSCHWSECSRNCGESTDKVAHFANSISVSYGKTGHMQYDVVDVADFTVNATCSCGLECAVNEGITLVGARLEKVGANEVTVMVDDASATVTIDAVKFNVVVNGTVAEDTYIYSASGSQDKSYGSQKELSTNGDNFRVFLRYNFSDVLSKAFYEQFKDEAKVQFTFTMTTGKIDNTTNITFKVYPVTDKISGVNLSDLTWKNYESYGLGWGNAYGFVEKINNSPLVSIDGNKITITVAYRELEEFIDSEGNAVFVLALWKSSTKVGSIENDTEANRPTVSVIFNEDHIHAYTEEVVDDKYFASAKCTEQTKYYLSCSCGEAGTKTFGVGDVIEHSYGEFVETKAPTCTEEGVSTKTCSKCNKTATKAIPVIAHSYSPVVTDPTCTEAGYTTYTCTCGDTYTADEVAATGHSYGDWNYDESYHWQACACGEVANKATHSGGEATETEQAICDTCNQPYGGTLDHQHNYQTVVTAPTCTEDGYTTYTCSCGDVKVDDHVDATGHSYTEWLGSETEHWMVCDNCDEVAYRGNHTGGEATETDKAVCEACGQSYGELKPAEKKERTIMGSIIEDTDINSSTKTKDRSGNDQIYLYSSAARGIIYVNLKDILNNADFESFKYEGTFYLTFTIAGNENDVNNTKFLFEVANPTYTALDGSTQYTAGIAPSAVTWNSIHVSGGAYYDALYLGNLSILIGTKKTLSNGTTEYTGKKLSETDKVIYTPGENGAAGTISYKLTYDEIKNYICMDQNSEYYGHIVFKFRASGSGTSASKTLYYASSETSTPPTVKFVYVK